MRKLFFLIALLGVSSLFAGNRYYRVMFRDDPATTACIGWDQYSGSNVQFHYSTTDHGTNVNAYENTVSVSRFVTYRGMDNNFVRLTGLSPNTAYYFIISDSEGNSSRYWFKTCPNVSTERLSFIAGGDSRNNRTPRQRANRLVAKLKPHAVLFGGDMTDDDTDAQWDQWMTDWQESIHSNGRIIPFVAARGNHESSSAVIYNLFDVPSSDAYFAITFGGNLVRAYTLNTEISISGNQTTWLENDLTANATSVCWKMAQYHKPMRPHVGSKSEGNSQYSNWASLFREYSVKLVVECDAHTVKTTWPVIPSSGTGSDEGFVRDDAEGTVYVGEGCWGAPLRSANDSKAWTRNSGVFNQFKWIFVDDQKIECRTIAVDNESSVGEVSDGDIFTEPTNLDVWNPSNGSVVEILKGSNNISPQVTIDEPDNGTYYSSAQFVSITALASDLDGSIERVEFYVDGDLQSTDYAQAYTASVFLDNGIHIITAKSYDNEGASSESSITVSVGVYSDSFSIQISSGDDDAEEAENGSIDLSSSDLELVHDTYQTRGDQFVGVRFNGITIPAGAMITSAYIQFTVDEVESGVSNLYIYAEDTSSAERFTAVDGNITDRHLTMEYETWSPDDSWVVGETTTNQQTPDLSQVIQEVIDRGDWVSGNSLAVIITGTGVRTVESYDGSPSDAAVLHLEYQVSNVTSMADEEEREVEVNPTKVNQYIRIYADKRFTWRLSTLNGVTFDIGVGNREEEIDVHNLPSGTYLLFVQHGEEQFVETIVKY